MPPVWLSVALALVFCCTNKDCYTHSAHRATHAKPLPRPGLRNRDQLGGFLAALRAAHPLRKLFERRGPADQARQALGSTWRETPHGQLTRTRNCPKQSSSFLI